MAAIFLQCEMPPASATSGRRYCGPPCSSNSRNSQIDTKRSPLPKGTVDLAAICAWAEMLSIWMGSSRKNTWKGLRASARAIDTIGVSLRCSSMIRSRSGPPASRAAAVMATAVSIIRACPLSWQSEVTGSNLIAVKPSSTAALAALKLASGVLPPESKCRRILSRTLPPNSSQTGTSKCLPLMSHSAISRAETAPIIAVPRNGAMR